MVCGFVGANLDFSSHHGPTPHRVCVIDHLYVITVILKLYLYSMCQLGSREKAVDQVSFCQKIRN